MCSTVAVLTLPLVTARLTIRMMQREHAGRLASYRTDPEVARFQDWKVPFTLEMAERLVDEQADIDGLVDDFIVQLAIELDGVAIGDLAVGLFDQGRQATLGYSISRHAQGNGYATEAAAAMVGALFEQAAVHRIVATIDPANAPSRRVLEKLGFRFEGRSPSSVFVRGEWGDDDRFAFLASEYPRRLRPDGRA